MKSIAIKSISHTSLNELHTCPRKFEINRLARQGTFSGNVHTAFGHAFGIGVQELFISNDLEQAIFKSYLAWDVDIYEEDEKNHKSIWDVIIAIQIFYYGAYQDLTDDWEIARLSKGEPAAELSFCIHMPQQFKYRGFVDIVLKHKKKNLFKILELKTTAARYASTDAMYANSSQAVGYSVVLDKIAENEKAESSFDVEYLVYKTGSREIERLNFNKSALDRALWLNQLFLESQTIQLYIDAEQFPKYGESCSKFNRNCEYFNMCQMSNRALTLSPRDMEKEDQEYQFNFAFEDLIKSQLQE